MFSLRCWMSGGVLIQRSNVVFRKSMKFRSHARRTLSMDFPVVACGRNSPKHCINKVVYRLYSNEVNEVKEELVTPANVVGEGTAEEIFNEIANGDPEVLRKLKLLQFEIEVYKQTDVRVPDKIDKHEWEVLLTLNSLSGRKRYLAFLFINEKKTINKKEKKKLKALKYLKEKEGVAIDPLSYNLSNQALFLRIYNRTLTQMLSFRNKLSEETAQHIIFDCSYQEYMSTINTKYCAMQLMYSLFMNHFHNFPCLIRLCNFKRTDELSKILPRFIQNIYNEDFLWTIHEKSYLDLYDKDKLVYLTPHCSEPLRMSPGDVYIIGAFVDKGCGVKASLARAKKYKLRMGKLPLDEYIQWKQGTKSLPLNIVLKILLDMKIYNNWPKALKNVPRRHYGSSDLDSDDDVDYDNIII